MTNPIIWIPQSWLLYSWIGLTLVMYTADLIWGEEKGPADSMATGFSFGVASLGVIVFLTFVVHWLCGVDFGFQG